MDKTITKEDEVEIEEVIKDKMEEENLEDRTDVPAINPEDNLKDSTDLSQEIKDSTNPGPSLTVGNLAPNPTKDNPALNQNKTAETKANQKKE